MAAIFVPLIGIIVAVLMNDSIPDNTLFWIGMFLVALLLMVGGEIRAYLKIHAKIKQERVQQRDEMINLIKERLVTGGDKKAMNAVDEAKLVEQMTKEFEARVAAKKGKG
jgi:small basic protein